MDSSETDLHLSQIETAWSKIFQAHQGRPEDAGMALHMVLLRYDGAIHRYILAITRDPELASELGQDFALRFLRGGFHRADPERGRFRDLIKAAIHNLVIDYHRRARARPRPIPAGVPEPASPPETFEELDRQYVECWRAEILEYAWKELAREQCVGGAPYYTVLRARADNPDLRSFEIAQGLSTQLGKPVTAGWFRQTLSVARSKYLDLVITEVAYTLGNPTLEQLEDELQNLGLWAYCREAWDRQEGFQEAG